MRALRSLMKNDSRRADKKKSRKLQLIPTGARVDRMISNSSLSLSLYSLSLILFSYKFPTLVKLPPKAQLTEGLMSSPSSPPTVSPPPPPPTCSLSSLTISSPLPPPPPTTQKSIYYRAYKGEGDLKHIVSLVDDELSEPYNLYTYRYFLDTW